MACLLDIFLSVATAPLGGGKVVEVSLDLCDAMFQWKKTLPQQTLHHRSHRWSVHQLKYKQMRLKIILMSTFEVVGAVSTYTAAGGDCDLDGVPARLADVLQV